MISADFSLSGIMNHEHVNFRCKKKFGDEVSWAVIREATQYKQWDLL